ncbi:UNVERIFIED_CONTAM: hypothetical protein PYX00_008492 [Menopon gallinae]|uniref:ATP synthase protein MI25 n=1 Tax=Menopon gallinae TaxID=328185 RepID=A0AAW2HNK0_9NEOP
MEDVCCLLVNALKGLIIGAGFGAVFAAASFCWLARPETSTMAHAEMFIRRFAIIGAAVYIIWNLTQFPVFCSSVSGTQFPIQIKMAAKHDHPGNHSRRRHPRHSLRHLKRLLTADVTGNNGTPRKRRNMKNSRYRTRKPHHRQHPQEI